MFERTMYRLLKRAREVREREDQLRHPRPRAARAFGDGAQPVAVVGYHKVAGAKVVALHLYVILDVFSRYVVGWIVAERESSTLAEQLIKQTCERQGIRPGQLTLHADRGHPCGLKQWRFCLLIWGDQDALATAYQRRKSGTPGAVQNAGNIDLAVPVRLGCAARTKVCCRAYAFLQLRTPPQRNWPLTPEAVPQRTAPKLRE